VKPLLAPLITLALTAPALAAPAPSDVEAAGYDGGDLPEGQSALTMKLQILLDRAGISPGVIDGYKGGMTESALMAFEDREGLEVDGVIDAEVWEALGGPSASGLTRRYTITEEDADIRGEPLPTDYAELAELDAMGFTAVAEKLAERFHMDEEVLRAMNEDAAFEAGETISVVVPGDPVEATVDRIEVRKGTRRLAALDAEGNVIANYPVGIGSDENPSPTGTHEVVAVAVEPTYSYRPSENFQQGENDEPLTLPPGPNGPVGLVWIDLSEPTYGIHGTPDPAKLFVADSHGCVRMTNWDAMELAGMTGQGVSVEFVQ
jgi:lipoprotein-anchoring transpeptidase ErfK/SrfK